MEDRVEGEDAPAYRMALERWGRLFDRRGSNPRTMWGRAALTVSLSRHFGSRHIRGDTPHSSEPWKSPFSRRLAAGLRRILTLRVAGDVGSNRLRRELWRTRSLRTSGSSTNQAELVGTQRTTKRPHLQGNGVVVYSARAGTAPCFWCDRGCGAFDVVPSPGVPEQGRGHYKPASQPGKRMIPDTSSGEACLEKTRNSSSARSTTSMPNPRPLSTSRSPAAMTIWVSSSMCEGSDSWLWSSLGRLAARRVTTISAQSSEARQETNAQS